MKMWQTQSVIVAEQVLVDCSGNEESEKTPETAFSNKKSALLRLAEESRVSRTIIFCNKVTWLLSFSVAHTLDSSLIPSLIFVD